MKRIFDLFTSCVNGRDEAGSRWALAALAGFVLALSGCSAPGPEGEFYDPLERQNRAVHEFNKSFDQIVFRPSSKAYADAVPDPAKKAVSNIASNLTMPNRLVNNLLQFDIEAAATTTMRFVSNTLFGFGGIFDIATEFGLPDEDTDFGQTLHTWNVGEGAFVELPLFGPNTARSAVGVVADIVLLDPLGYLIPNRDEPFRAGIWTMDKLGERNQYGELIDEMLYASPDSYVTERSYYLQNRRFRLSKELTEADLEDPYAE